MTVERVDRLRQTRRELLRTAIIWTPLFLAALAGGLFLLIIEVTGDGNGWILPALLLIFGALFAYQGLGAVNDLRRGTRMLSGFITRHWRRFDLGSRSNYLRIDHDKIIRLDRVQHLTVSQGDYVEVEYYPSSMIAVVVRKQEPPEGAGEPPDDGGDSSSPEPDPLLIERG